MISIFILMRLGCSRSPSSGNSAHTHRRRRLQKPRPYLILFGGATAIHGGASSTLPGIRLAGVTNSVHFYDVLTRKWTRFFSYSLDERIIPRYNVMVENRVNFKLRYMLASTYEQFKKRVEDAVEKRSSL